MKKIMLNVLMILYLIIVTLTTLFLINYNDYKVAILGNKSYLRANRVLNGNYSSNALLVIKNDLDNLKVGDTIIYYNKYESQVEIEEGKLSAILDEKTLIVGKESLQIEPDDVLGKQKSVKKIAFIGLLVSLFTSKFGYLFLIIFPTLIIFAFELYLFVKVIRKKNNE